MDLTPPRGTVDLVPPSGGRMRALYERAARLAGLYGYRYVETPEFEHTELIHRSSGETSDIVTKETYTFTDRGGRSITLRPEGTAPVMRAYLAHAHDLPTPFKAFYLARMYRYGRPQAGRLREHRQFGIEVIGEEGPGADVEVIVVGDRFLRALGLRRYAVQVNSIGDGTCRPAYREELVAYLESNRERISDEHRDRLRDNPLRVLDCKDPACRAVAAEAPRIADRLCDPCRDHFDAVLTGLREEGLEPIVTHTLVRGLDYYTRTAFEFVSLAIASAQSTVFGGGRYDGLAEALGGPHVPGVGYGMGLERVLLAMDEEGLEPPEEGPLDCFVVTVGEAARERGRQVLNALRAAGLSADASFGVRSLGAQMKAADRGAARFAVIVGERESARGTVTWRRLADGAQFEGELDEALSQIGAAGAGSK
jgi:histidyl-tRNA synthetase